MAEPKTNISRYRSHHPELKQFSDDDIFEATRRSTAPDMDADTWKEGFLRTYGDPKESPGMLANMTGGFVAGVGDVLSTTGGAIDFIAQNKEQNFLTKAGLSLAESNPPPPDIAGKSIADDPSILLNWGFWEYNLPRLVPFTASALATGGTGMAVGKGIATGLNLAKTGLQTARIVGGAVGSGLYESLAEAGGARNEAIEMGKTPQEANAVAGEVLAHNVAINVLINAVQYGKVLKAAKVSVTGAMLKKGWGKVASDLAVTSGAESLQEMWQQVASNMALDRDPMEGLPESAVLGFAGGLMFGGGLELLEESGGLTPERVQKSIDDIKGGKKPPEGGAPPIPGGTGIEGTTVEAPEGMKELPTLEELKKEVGGAEVVKAKEEKEKKRKTSAQVTRDSFMGAQISDDQVTDLVDKLEEEILKDYKAAGVSDEDALNQLIKLRESVGSTKEYGAELSVILDEKTRDAKKNAKITKKVKESAPKPLTLLERLEQEQTAGATPVAPTKPVEAVTTPAPEGVPATPSAPPTGGENAPVAPPAPTIPPTAKKEIQAKLLEKHPDGMTGFGAIDRLSDADLIEAAKQDGLYENAPADEAPGSEGRGTANQAQIDKNNRIHEVAKKIINKEELNEDDVNTYSQSMKEVDTVVKNTKETILLNQRELRERQVNEALEELRTVGIVKGEKWKSLPYEGKKELIKKAYNITEDQYSNIVNQLIKQYAKVHKTTPEDLLNQFTGIATKRPEDMNFVSIIESLNQAEVFHGSPELFQMYDKEKIGTGEGGQAYGHGFYFTTNQDVAEYFAKDAVDSRDRSFVHYKGVRAFNHPELTGQQMDAVMNFALEKAKNKNLTVSFFIQRYAQIHSSDGPMTYQDIKNELDKIDFNQVTTNIGKRQANIYKVTLWKGKIPGKDYTILSWTGEIGQEMSDLINKIAPRTTMTEKLDGRDIPTLEITPKSTGQHAYMALADRLAPRSGMPVNGFKLASDALLANGINGIKSESRYNPEATTYVAFDPADVTIEEVNQIYLQGGRQKSGADRANEFLRDLDKNPKAVKYKGKEYTETPESRERALKLAKHRGITNYHNTKLHHVDLILGYPEIVEEIRKEMETEKGMSVDDREVVLEIERRVYDDRDRTFTTGFKIDKSFWSREQIDEFIADLMNQQQDDDGGEYYQGARGAVGFLEDGNAMLLAFQSPDMSTFLHEMFGHFVAMKLSSEEENIALENYRGKSLEEFTHDDWEDIAVGFEKYMATGQAPVPELKSVFAKLKDFLLNLYSGIKEFIDPSISPQLKEVFDSWFSEEAKTNLERSIRRSTLQGNAEIGTIENINGRSTRRRVGSIEGVSGQKVIHKQRQLRRLGYQSTIFVDNADAGTYEVMYYINKDDPKVQKALQLRQKEVNVGLSNSREVAQLGVAYGFTPEAVKGYLDEWTKNLEAEKERMRGAGIPTKAPSGSSSAQATAKRNAELNANERPVDPLADEPNEQDIQDYFNENFGDDEIAKEVAGEFLEASTPKTKESAIQSILGTQEEGETAGVAADEERKRRQIEAELGVIGEGGKQFARIQQLTLDYIQAGKDGDTKKQKKLLGQIREAQESHVKKNKNEEALTEEGAKSTIDNDPDNRDPFKGQEPLSQDQRDRLQSELGLSKEETDGLSDDDLEDMMKNKYPSEDGELYTQSTVGGPFTPEQNEETKKIGKSIFERMTPKQVQAALKQADLTPEELRRARDTLYMWVGTSQVLARYNPDFFGRVFWAVDKGIKLANQITTRNIKSPEYGAIRAMSPESKMRVMTAMVNGTLHQGYVENPLVDAVPMRIYELVHTKEEVVAEKARRNELRSQYERNLYEAKGRIWTDEELKSGQYLTRETYGKPATFFPMSDEEIKAYKYMRSVTDEMTKLWQLSAITYGMPKELADEVYGLHAYFPLSRGTGKFSLLYKDPESPKEFGWERFDNLDEAEALRTELIRMGRIDPTDADYTVKRVSEIPLEYYEKFGIWQLIDVIHDAGYTSEEIGKNKTLQRVLNEFKSRSYAGARMIPRGNVGLTVRPDLLFENFEIFVERTAKKYARAISRGEVDAAFSKSNGDGRLASQWNKFAKEYVRHAFAPVGTSAETWDFVRRAGFLWSLAFNVSNALLNLTQPLVTTLPFLNEKGWGLSFANSTRVMAKAIPIASSFANPLASDQSKKDFEIFKQYPDLRRALDEWKNEAVISASLQEELIGNFGGTSKWTHKLALLQSLTEKQNRVMSAVSGYLAAQDHIIGNAKGNRTLANELAEITSLTPDQHLKISLEIEPENRATYINALKNKIANDIFKGELSPDMRHRIATRFGARTSDTTQFVFGKHTMPKFIYSMGALENPLKSAFLFKGFLFNYAGFLFTGLQSGRISPKQVTVALLPMMMLAGISGVPFGDDLKELAKTFGIGDIDSWVRENINDETMADLILKGVPSAMFSVDFSRRAGAGQILPEGAAQGNFGEALMDVFGGAPISMIGRIGEGAADFWAGDYALGLQKMSPVTAANVIKSFRYESEGAISSRGDLLVSPKNLSYADKMKAGFGFKPLNVAKAEDWEAAMRYLTTERRDKVAQFNTKISRAIRQSDREDLVEIFKEIREYNSEADRSNKYQISDQLPAIRRKVALGLNADIDTRFLPKAMRKEGRQLRKLYK